MKYPNPVSFGDKRLWILIPIVTIVIVTILSSFIILSHPSEPILDQIFTTYRFDREFIVYSLHASGYPPIELGITSYLFAGLYNLMIGGDVIHVNMYIRVFAAALYLGSASLLFWKIWGKNSPLWYILIIGLVFTSRYPLLWLSTELFAGAFLMLTLWSVVSNHSFWITALLLGAFSFVKPDLIFSGLIVGVFLAWAYANTKQAFFLRIGTILAICALFVLPGLLQHGLGYLQSQGRAMLSFQQHYAAVVQRHQIISPTPDPWWATEAYIPPAWRAATNLIAVIRADPNRYMDFVFLSASVSIRNIILANIALLVPFAIYSGWVVRPRRLFIIGCLFFVGFAPLILLSYVHIRYLARFYPVLLFLISIGLSQTGISSRWRRSSFFFLTALLLLQTYQFSKVIAAYPWFPD